MNKLSWEQRRALADFLTQFAVIILGSGLIVPVFSENLPNNIIVTSPVAIVSAGTIIAFMLFLLKKGER